MKPQLLCSYTELSVKYPKEVLASFASISLFLIGCFYFKDSAPVKVIAHFLGLISLLYAFNKLRILKKSCGKQALLFAIFSIFFSALFSWICLKNFKIEGQLITLYPVLILMDTKRMKNLCVYVFRDRTRNEILTNVTQGVAKLSPQMTLDVLLKALMLSMGLFLDNEDLNYLSIFACLAVFIDFFIFIALYPAYLALLLQSKSYKLPAKNDKIENSAQKFVLKKIKVIMCTCLITIHIYAHFNQNRMVFIHFKYVRLVNLQTVCLCACAVALIKILQWIYRADENFKTQENEVAMCEEKKVVNNEIDDEQIIKLIKDSKIPPYNLENLLENYERAVKIRRKLIGIQDGGLPYRNYEYSKIFGVCCENVIGYATMPVGVAGPLNLDEELIYIPMATTEGCLVASTNRGCRALRDCGVDSFVMSDGMTRGPVVKFPDLKGASAAFQWILKESSFDHLKKEFDSTSQYADLKSIKPHLAGRILFLRFLAKTGDAMGMNMLTKGTEQCLRALKKRFYEMEVISVSGNYCSDKKPSALNWIEGRGKCVTCNALIPEETVKSMLKTSCERMAKVNLHKNLIGSAVAGSIGGFNAHASNIVAAMFIATGQDPAQTVTSCNCLTIMEREADGLYVSCTMPSLEVGTIGGGTVLSAQSACLELLGVKGSGLMLGENAKKLAKIICATVLAGEISLIAAQAEGHLGESHLKLNREKKDSPIL